MLSDKDIKKKYKPVFRSDPEKYYPTDVLRTEGFVRKICSTCEIPFWSVDINRQVCGDPACNGEEGFSFIGKSPAKEPLSYAETWKKFKKMFEGFGYTPIKRYPVVARWNPTMEYTNASIAAFQPYVVSGEIKPPAERLTIPQFCMRFNDIDNVGITGSHCTGFVMVGQLQFVPPERWNQNEAFRHMFEWNTKGLGLKKEHMTFHEDAWAGGGNLGCCMEFFSGNAELWNQVYMLYEQTPSGVKDLKMKVLDMGLGLERNAWFTQGTNTIYDAIMPETLSKILKIVNFDFDRELQRKFVPYGGMLNLDEVESINLAWEAVSKQVGYPVNEIKKHILPLAAVYSVAEHSRSLLFAMNDGALPSNVGGGYNLRILLRRMLGFLEQYKWNIDPRELLAWHAKELKPIFPELTENLDNIGKILDVEKAKFKTTRQKASHIIKRILEKEEEVSEDKLIQLYDSNGISPELLKEEAKKQGKKIHVPEGFYAMVAEKHGTSIRIAKAKETHYDLHDIPHTKPMYFDDWKKSQWVSKCVKVVDNYVILDQTYFYPTSGGQDHDLGSMNGQLVVTIIKQGPFILHLLDSTPAMKEGDVVNCGLNFDRRLQLTQHHTSTHIIGAAARELLGHHINQAGARKTVEKAHIDITHYESLSEQDIEAIEKRANEIVQESIPIVKGFEAREDAERKYGVTIYQGGVAPGKELRIVNITGLDVQACGGTHLDNTREAELIKILKTAKIQDGIVRLIFAAGKAAKQYLQQDADLLAECAALLGCEKNQVYGRAMELFTKWKKVKKLRKKGKDVEPGMLKLSSTDTVAKSETDILGMTLEALKTQAEHLVKTIKRFQSELK